MREDLEAALRARPDDATLLVYADYLQAQGDPRGELIALDLRAPAMSMQSIEVRRGQLLHAWLGDDIDLTFDRAQQLWYAGDLDGTFATFDLGFIDLVVAGDVPLLLDTPAADFLRRVSVEGDTSVLAAVVPLLVDRPRPWLQQVSLIRTAGSTLLVGRSLGERFSEATPHLEVLDLGGENLFDRFTHPNVRELGVVGSDVLDLVDGPPFRALTSIDYLFEGDRPTPRGLFGAARMPKVRRVDFGRNEPGATHAFPALGTLALAPQITQLVLPSLRTHRDHALVQAGIDRMPLLREVSFARAYAIHGWFEELRHPTARVTVPPQFPWQPRDMLDDYQLTVDGVAVDVCELVELLEASYPEQPEHLQAPWFRFWRSRSMPARELAGALVPLPLDGRLAQLRDHLVAELAKRGDYIAELDWRG